MTREEKLELVENFYALSGAGDYAASRELLTEDFSITIPPYMPFAGTYRGQDAFRELIPIVKDSVALAGLKFPATAVGDDCVAKLVEFTLEGDDRPPVEAVEVIRFRGDKICEIRPYFFDPAPMIAAAERRKEAREL